MTKRKKVDPFQSGNEPLADAEYEKYQKDHKPTPTPTPLSISELRLRIDDTEFCTRVLCAVNAHGALVEALKEIKDTLRLPIVDAYRIGECIKVAEQALAQAEGK